MRIQDLKCHEARVWSSVISRKKKSYLGLDFRDKFSLRDNNFAFSVNVNIVTAVRKHENKWVVGNKKIKNLSIAGKVLLTSTVEVSVQCNVGL